MPGTRCLSKVLLIGGSRGTHEKKKTDLGESRRGRSIDGPLGVFALPAVEKNGFEKHQRGCVMLSNGFYECVVLSPVLFGVILSPV